MELRQLDYFAKIAEAGSVSGAAVLLHLTQPTLSRQLAALEREVGHRLFERTPDGMVLTPAGRGLLGQIRVLSAEVDRIPEIVRTFSKGQEVIRVGLPPGVPHDWFLDVLARSRQDAPLTTLSVTEASSDEQQALLHRGMIDLALLHLRPLDLGTAELFTQHLGVAVQPSSRLYHRTAVSFADLDRLAVMAHAAQEFSSGEARLRVAAIAAGTSVRWVFRRFAEHSELIAVSSGVDAVAMTEASARRNLSGWRWIPFADSSGDDLTVHTWAVWRRPPRVLVRRLVDFMTETPYRLDDH